ncbi:MAG TPA: hypothetical protein VF950_09860 [Planctomycetota bacterium]
MMILWPLLLLPQTDPGVARLRAVEARERAEARIGLFDGVRSVGMGGTGTEYRLIIAVDSLVTKAVAREALGGDEFEGLRILWTVTGNGLPVLHVAAPPPPADPPPAAAAPVPAPPPLGAVPGNFWNAKPEDCDIIRDHLKLKKIQHPSSQGRSWLPCAVHLRQVVGAGGGHTFTYTKHRPDCPIRTGRVGMPPYADNFIAWVYSSGYTYPIRAGFTWPYELRASDSLWARQAWGDLESRMGYVRSGGTQVPPIPVPTGR